MLNIIETIRILHFTFHNGHTFDKVEDGCYYTFFGIITLALKWQEKKFLVK